MDVMTSNFMPGDPRLIEQIVYELKSQGIFDQFRKECIADVDTKPAYQNLSQRVEGSVMNFLNQQRFTEDINKNQLRDQLRKNITESGFLESGVERIVDQVVNPKINTVFLPKVEDVVYRFLGIERPTQEHKQLEVKPSVEDLLPNDLEAVSPESVNDHSLNYSVEKSNDNAVEANDNSLNSSNAKTEDESPPFEPLEENTKFSVHEENSVDSHLSGMSGLASHDSTQSSDVKMDISQGVSQNSINSEGNLSIITSEEGIKMEICENSLSGQGESFAVSVDKSVEPESKICSDVKDIRPDKDEVGSPNNNLRDTCGEVNNSKEIEEKTQDSIKNDAKKTHEKHRSSRGDKDRKDDKDKRSRSKSDSKREKSNSKSTSSSKDKEKGKEEISEKSKVSKKEDKERDKNKEKSSSRTKDKEKSERSRERSEKSKDKSAKDKERANKDRLDKEKSDKDKSKSATDKYKSSKDKDKSDKSKSEKDNNEKDKNSLTKHNKEKPSNQLNKDHREGDKHEDKYSKDKNSSSKDKSSSSNKHKDPSSKDRDSSKSSKDKDKSKTSSSGSKDKEKDKKGGGDSKSKLSDKYKKHDKDKHASGDKNNLPSKKSRNKKVTDDHYSMKDKKSDRRSTDRDSNDGSSKTGRNSSLADTCNSAQKESRKETSEVFSSGGGESSNSDRVEESSVEERQECSNSPNIEVIPAIRYIKPKFASNIHEAMKIMKIRKRLAKLERQNQLALANHPLISENSLDLNSQQNIHIGESARMTTGHCETDTEKTFRTKPVGEQTFEISNARLNSEDVIHSDVKSKKSIETTSQVEDVPVLKSRDLSMETFEALEARLAEEMSNINVHLYGDEDDTYEYSSISISPVKKRKTSDAPTVSENKPPNDNLMKTPYNITEQASMPEQTKEVENDTLEDSGADPEVLLAESGVQKTILESEAINNHFKNPNDNMASELGPMVEEVAVEEVPSTSHEPDNSIIASSVKETDTGADHVDITDNIRESSDHIEAVQEEFKGFKDSDKEDSLLTNINQLINKISYDINKKYIESHQEFCGSNVAAPVNLRKSSGRSQLQNLLGDYSLGSPLKVGMKETKSRACLQKNGKKLSIKIDKLNIEVTPKVLVTLQDAGLDEVVKNHVADKIRVLNDVKDNVPNGAKEIMGSRSRTRKQNGQVTKDDNNATVMTSHNMTINPFIEGRVNEESLIAKWEDENSPCLFFDKSNSVSDTHLVILKDAIGRLQKSIEDQSLKVQNNIPTPKKRSRKKKAPSENNNSLCSDYKPERKRRLLSDANSNQNMDNNMCNTNVSSQSFTLPLSPAESDKSVEPNKEEPVTVKIKKARGATTKRYSSEDLYKPRPILSCTRSRRRTSRIGDNRP